MIIKNKIMLGFALLLILLLSGCGREQTLTQTEVVIPEISKPVQEECKAITEKAIQISDSAEKIFDISDSNEVKNEAILIKSISNEIINSVVIIRKDINQLKTLEDLLRKITKERDKAIEARNQVILDKNSDMNKMLGWIIIASIIGAGIFGVFFLVNGSKTGIFGAVGCAIVLGISILVKSYTIYLAIGGGLIFLGLIVILGYNIWINRKAFTEVVNTVEKTKEKLTEENKTKLFGGEKDKGEMEKIQSKTTIDLVNKVREKIIK